MFAPPRKGNGMGLFFKTEEEKMHDAWVKLQAKKEAAIKETNARHGIREGDRTKEEDEFDRRYQINGYRRTSTRDGSSSVWPWVGAAVVFGLIAATLDEGPRTPQQKKPGPDPTKP